MRTLSVRFALVAAVACFASVAHAHEFTCSATPSLLATDAAGLTALDANGLPIPVGDLGSSILTVRGYPATVGVLLTLRNVVDDTSVVTGLWDTLDSTGGAPAVRYGPIIGEGFALPPGGTAAEWFTFTVDSQEACLKVFGGAVGDAPVCSETTNDRFVITNDVGSTECRARVVCGSPQEPPPLAGPVPPPECPPTWHGVKQLGASGEAPRIATAGVALGPQCGVDVAGTLSFELPEIVQFSFLAPFTASGEEGQLVQWGGSSLPTTTGLAEDLAGNRFVAWGDQEGAHVTKLDSAGATLWTTLVGNLRATAVTVDVAGNAYVVGGAPSLGWLVAKLRGDGAIAWTRLVAPQLAVSVNDHPAVALDAVGDVLVAGTTSDANFVTQPVVAKLDAEGNVVWLRMLGTLSEHVAHGIATNAAGEVFVSGGFAAFVAKLDGDGNLDWFRQLMVPGPGDARAVAVDAAGDVWVAGDGRFTPPSHESTAFVARLDAAGNPMFLIELGTSPTPGTSDTNVASGLALDAAGDVFVSWDSSVWTVSGRSYSALVAKIDPLGNVQ